MTTVSKKWYFEAKFHKNHFFERFFLKLFLKCFAIIIFQPTFVAETNQTSTEMKDLSQMEELLSNYNNQLNTTKNSETEFDSYEFLSTMGVLALTYNWNVL